MAGTLLSTADGMDYSSIIDKYYPAGSRMRDIYMLHCRQVADRALEIAHAHHLPLDDEDINAAAMLHDIGICLTDAPSIDCHGSENYLKHGILGAKLLRDEGVDEKIARVAERHTGAGISAADVVERDLPLPVADYMPETLLERLVCYADKFFSKNKEMKEKPLERVIASMEKISPETLDRFLALHREFSSDNNLQNNP